MVKGMRYLLILKILLANNTKLNHPILRTKRFILKMTCIKTDNNFILKLGRDFLFAKFTKEEYKVQFGSSDLIYFFIIEIYSAW